MKDYDKGSNTENTSCQEDDGEGVLVVASMFVMTLILSVIIAGYMTILMGKSDMEPSNGHTYEEMLASGEPMSMGESIIRNIKAKLRSSSEPTTSNEVNVTIIIK